MLKPRLNVTKNGGNTAGRTLNEALERLKQAEVLVGVPSETTARQEKKEMNNATLAAIHTYGSPLRNIPSRPFLEPAIEANIELIAPELGDAAKAIFEKQPDQALLHLKRSGQVASNSVKRWWDDPRNGWAPNSPATVRRKGSEHPLIDTGQLRRSITYVVREE